MIAEAIQHIQDITRDITVAITDASGEREYATGGLTPIKATVPEPLAIHTLQGLVDWFKSKDVQTSLVQIVGYNQVLAISGLLETWQQRRTYVKVELPAELRFPFGQFMELE